jgi:hypothetical protein
MPPGVPSANGAEVTDRRTGLRRDADHEQRAITLAVRDELVRQRRRWIATWLLTLALSGWAWYLASDANDRTNALAQRADVTAKRAARQSRLQCERSRRILPFFVQTLERASDAPREEVQAFKALLPKHC